VSVADPLLALVRPEIRAISAYKTPLDPLPIKLDANESPFGLPAEVMADLAERVSALPLQRYPDIEVRALKQALGRWLDTSPSRLVVGVGSDESIGVLLTALARPRSAKAPAIVVPEPTFVMYGQTARVLGLEPVSVPLAGRDFALDVSRTIDAIRAHQAVLVFLASPNNPTGVAYRHDDLLAVAEACPDTMVVVDEAYGAFRPKVDGRRASHREALRAHLSTRARNVVFLGTLSKIGLASLRIGWIEAPEALAHELDKVRLPYDVPGPTQVLGAAVLDAHRAALEAQIATIVAERDRVVRALERLHTEGGPLRPIPTEANFFLCETSSASRATEVHAHFASRGIQVRAFRAGTLERHLRITIGLPAENDALLEALSDDTLAARTQATGR
jgi:histidinol-phosphate aminotransferase